MASASDFYIQAADRIGGTYRRVHQADPNYDTVYKIASSVTNAFVPVPPGLKYVKVEASTANTAALEFKFICGG
jgi:hypothetical protein